jgi:hypothetical protein
MPLIVTAAPVTEGDVEETIRPEGELAAVVVAGWLRNNQENFLAGRIGRVRVGREVKPADHRRAVENPGVVDVEIGFPEIARGKSQAKQALLSSADQPSRDIEEGGWLEDSAAQNSYLAALFDHEQAAAPVPGMDDGDGAGEPGRNLGKGQGQGGLELRGIRLRDHGSTATTAPRGKHQKCRRQDGTYAVAHSSPPGTGTLVSAFSIEPHKLLVNSAQSRYPARVRSWPRNAPGPRDQVIGGPGGFCRHSAVVRG